MNKRLVGIDIVKVVAVMFVICVHFFLNTKFYSQNLTPGENLFAQTLLRWVFYTCVPLFIISTGYLQSKKVISAKYYKGIIPVLGVYLFYCLLSVYIRIKYFGETTSALYWIYSIVSFRADGYSWYVNMYIGLFLLIPFLNIIFNNLRNKRERILLISTLIALCGLPSLNNVPITINGQNIIFFPDWWKNIWPLVYYFLGCYIKEYQTNFKKHIIIVSFLLVVLVQTVSTYYFSNGGPFSKVFDGYNSLLVILSSVLFFLIFYNVDFGSKLFRNSIGLISSLTLDIYLASYVVDVFVYRYVRYNIFESNYQIIYYFIPIVGTVIISSVIISLARKYLTKSIALLIKHLKTWNKTNVKG